MVDLNKLFVDDDEPQVEKKAEERQEEPHSEYSQHFKDAELRHGKKLLEKYVDRLMTEVIILGIREEVLINNIPKDVAFSIMLQSLASVSRFLVEYMIATNSDPQIVKAAHDAFARQYRKESAPWAKMMATLMSRHISLDELDKFMGSK